MRSNLWDGARQDLRYAARLLRRSPGFAAIAVLTLALGIGGMTTIFSVVNGVILHPLPYGNANRLVRVDEIRRAPVGSRPFVPPPRDSDWQARTSVFEGVVSFEYAPFTFTDGSDAPLILGARVPV